jgi:hypothetical protein
VSLREPSHALSQPPDDSYSAAHQSPLLRRLHDRHSLAETIRLGCWVQQEFLAARGVGATSFRAFVRQSNISAPVSSSWRAIAIWQLSQKFPEIIHCRHLGVAHFGVILSVPEPFQLQLIRQAEYHRWSRSRLVTEISSLRTRQSESRCFDPEQRLGEDFCGFHPASSLSVPATETRLAG